MDDSEEGVLLIATTMVVLTAFAMTVLAVMIIYRKRKLQHAQEISEINEKFSRELLEAELEVQRQTMQHIGREIHDHVGQQLTLAFLYMQQMQPQEAKMADRIQSVITIIDESLADLRNLSRSLTNSTFIHGDLDQLIDIECAKVRSARQCEVNFRASTSPIESSADLKSYVVRILQEFLQNSMKHSQCKEIAVELSGDEKGIVLNAMDDGKGFMETDEQAGIGLANMRKRAAIIGADLSIESSYQRGTRLKLFIPSQQLTFTHATQHRHS
ncbi:MAG: ATP-binding protein [Cyclobacteriaceae bacterium]